MKNLFTPAAKLFKLALLAAVAISCSSKNQDSEKTNATFTLTDTMLAKMKTADVTNTRLKNELRLFGKITADNNKLVEVFPVVGGYVTSVKVELGDHVEKGQLLATIRSTEVAGYEKDKLDAENDVVVAEKNLKVTTDLFESKLASEKDVIAAKSELVKAQAELNRIREVFSIYSMKGSATYEVRAPISGFVVQKNINIDMQLRSDRTDNIFDIAQIEEVWALANVNESDIAKVKIGFNADVKTLSYPDKIFHGQVDKIFNVIDPDTKAMKVRIKLNNSDLLLKPEMTSTVLLSFEEPGEMLAVPSASVIFDKSKYFVMVFKDKSHIETRQVEVFRQVGDVTFISSGITEGEKVITTTNLLIYDALND